MSIIKINVHPFVKNVLIKEFGKEPISAAQNSLVGIIVRPLLTDKSNYKGQLKGEQNTLLDIKIPTRLRHLTHNKNENYSDNQAIFLTEESLIKVKHTFKKLAERMIVQSIICYTEAGMPTMKAFDKIYDKYNLDEELLPRDSLMNFYKRHKRSLVKLYNNTREIKNIIDELNIGGKK